MRAPDRLKWAKRRARFSRWILLPYRFSTSPVFKSLLALSPSFLRLPPRPPKPPLFCYFTWRSRCEGARPHEKTFDSERSLSWRNPSADLRASWHTMTNGFAIFRPTWRPQRQHLHWVSATEYSQSAFLPSRPATEPGARNQQPALSARTIPTVNNSSDLSRGKKALLTSTVTSSLNDVLKSLCKVCS